MNMASFTNWSIANSAGSGQVWRIYEGQTAPLLLSFLKPLTPGNTTVTYNGLVQTGSTALPVGVLGSYGSGTHVGTYSGGSLYTIQQGYDISGSGSLVISKAHLTVTADNQTRLYGQTNPTLTQTITGFANGETLATSGVTGSATASTTATATTNAGSATISASTGNLSASNYDFTAATVNAALTIDKAHLTVTADNQTRLYGQTNPTLTQTISGFANGETLATSGVTGAASGSTTATATTNAGTSAISPSTGNLSASNYDFTAATGNAALTIDKAHLTVTADNQTRQYGEANPTFTQTITGFAPGQTLATSGVLGNAPNANSSAVLRSSVGNVVITGSTSGLSSDNYDFVASNGTLNITPKPITGSINTVNTLYGATYIPGSVNLSGVLSGDQVFSATPTLNTTGLTSNSGYLKAGNHIGIEAVSGSLTGPDAGNYSFTGATGNYTVTPAPLVVSGLVASTKVYDTSTVANVSTAGVVYGGLLASDAVSVNATGLFNDKNAGIGKTVTLSSTLSGADAGNYSISSQSAASTLADITPGILTLVATPIEVFNGQIPGDLSGSVTGFAGNDTLKTATTGTLTWSTSVTSSSPPGIYAIEGKGLSSANYLIRQSSRSLLTIKPSAPPQPVVNARAQLASYVQPVVPETKYPSLISTTLFFNDKGSTARSIQPGAQLSFMCWLQSTELNTQQQCRAAL